MSNLLTFRTPARPSQRDTRAVAGAAIAQTEHVQTIIQRGIIPALGAAQGAIEVESIHREAGDAALDARLRVHRCELDEIDGWLAEDRALLGLIEAHLADVARLTFAGRLRWLLTGKVR